jgi:hypothetical protein
MVSWTVTLDPNPPSHKWANVATLTNPSICDKFEVIGFDILVQKLKSRRLIPGIRRLSSGKTSYVFKDSDMVSDSVKSADVCRCLQMSAVWTLGLGASSGAKGLDRASNPTTISNLSKTSGSATSLRAKHRKALKC